MGIWVYETRNMLNLDDHYLIGSVAQDITTTLIANATEDHNSLGLLSVDISKLHS